MSLEQVAVALIAVGPTAVPDERSPSSTENDTVPERVGLLYALLHPAL